MNLFIGYVLGYLLNASLAFLAVFVYGAVMCFILLWFSGFLTKLKK